ncbi:T-complex protein 1 subunit theta [Malassezia vespertilionis]|uniref:CCT-theta n=1 Tax=Malassezia vespertilionis TaxID=2020962 RepID=A0A2N1JG69_9BASI|nr:T-complex protein 1 subunit theta [Malassezia vespertilionis]PKI85526.1 Cct8p [Malassezia vespertilionis]WFD04904.1 T-complex protein 1 subunit theta [Malassezia vespertilionis]
MALKVPRAGGPTLFKEGYQHLQGIEEAVLRNIHAVCELSDIVRTSFGPMGRNKMIVNHLGRTFVTSDAATIIREMEVVHPAAKLIVYASQQQDAEMGDGTNFVLTFAGELLRKAQSLITLGLHPSEIIQGYELARDRTIEQLEHLSIATLSTPPTQESLALALRPTLASQQYGSENILAPLLAQALSLVLPENSKLRDLSVDNVRVVKIMGGSLAQSRVVRGMVFGREPDGSVRSAHAAKVAVFTCGIDISQTETKGTVLLHNAKELQQFTRGEEAQLERIVHEIAAAGVKAVVAQSTVGELALHYLNRMGIFVIKVQSKFDLQRLCRLVGATPLARLGAPTPEEAGWVDTVETTEIGGDRVTIFRQEDDQPGGKSKPRLATVVLRGATTSFLDDVERTIDDGVNAVKALVRDPRLVPGAGATEVELSRRVMEYGEKTPGLNQHAIKKYGESLQVIPRTLAETAGLDAVDVVNRLLTKHNNPERTDMGVDVDQAEDGTMSTVEAQVFDVLLAKHWAIRYATSAAIDVLKVDSIIMSKPAGIKAPGKNPHWDED